MKISNLNNLIQIGSVPLTKWRVVNILGKKEQVFNLLQGQVTSDVKLLDNGECQLSNKRVSLNVKIPSQPMVRRSDDALKYNCKTADGKTGFGSIPSEIESGKLAGSVVFFDLGITDSITDKHRTYPASFVIPVN